MNIAKKIIAFLSLTLLCVSCTPNNKQLSHDDFESYYFTKWAKDDNSFTFYAEGKGRPWYGVGYFENNETRFQVDTMYHLVHLTMIIHNNAVRFEYDLEKVINDNSWDGTIRAYNNKTKEDFCLHPKPIGLDEIDLNHFMTTNLINVEKNISFYFHEKSSHEQCNVWLCYNGDEQYSLSFGEDRSFVITNQTEIVTGTYVPNYEFVKLIFNDNEIFEQDELILNYSFGDDSMQMN